MTDALPIKLLKEPLIDAVFELRFMSSISASNVLPGYLFSKLDGKKTIERLPAADFPRPMRDMDLIYSLRRWLGFTGMIL